MSTSRLILDWCTPDQPNADNWATCCRIGYLSFKMMLMLSFSLGTFFFSSSVCLLFQKLSGTNIWHYFSPPSPSSLKYFLLVSFPYPNLLCFGQAPLPLKTVYPLIPIPYTVSQQWLQPMSDRKRNFIAESFLRHTYMNICIGAKNIHRALFEKICFLKA